MYAKHDVYRVVYLIEYLADLCSTINIVQGVLGSNPSAIVRDKHRDNFTFFFN
jgi:hypothetical protein